MTRARFALVLGLVTAGAFMLRAVSLDTRPMHTDEAIHAYKVDQLRRGEYRYDPYDFHGPTLYYATLPVIALESAPDWTETDEGTYRIVPAFFGALLVLVTALLTGAIGRSALLAAALTALSPAMVFYSRYYIQEMPFVLFTACTLFAAHRYLRQARIGRRAIGWCVATGVCAGLMHATKETAILSFAAMGIGAVGIWWWRRTAGLPAPGAKIRAVVLGIAVALATAWLLLSQFGAQPGALLASFRAYGLQGETGLHEHPWYFYLDLLLAYRYQGGPLWTEGFLLVLAVVGVVAAIAGRGVGAGVWFARFIAIYALSLVAIYAAIPHKTPWAMLSSLHAIVLLAGVGATALLRIPHRAPRVAVMALLLAGTVHLGWQAHRAAVRFAADPRNPYVYAQTVRDTVRLGARVDELAGLHVDGRDMRIDVFVPGDDYWPLPWYLRRMNATRIAYRSDVPETSDGPTAPVVISMPALADKLRARLGEDYHTSTFGLRPGVLLELHVHRKLWARFIATRSRTTSSVVRAHHRAMATTFDIAIDASHDSDDRTHARQAATEAFRLIDRVEDALSHYRPASEVSQLNRLEPSETLRLSRDAFDCLHAALELTVDTGGAFDAGVGPLLATWARADRAGARPSPSEIDAARAASGIRHLVLDADTMTAARLHADVTVDLGGIGKGYAVDRACESLREWGIESALVHGGHSSVRAFGGDVDGWPLTLPDPRAPEEPLGTVRLRDRAMGASGLARGAPIIDPRTGQRVDHHVAAWAWAPTATIADALSTACIVWRAEEIEHYCAAHPTVSALVVTRASPRVRVFGSPGFIQLASAGR